jgi:uncharacterized membrane protein YdjX (TVP38/TMEM64 family)
MSTSGPHSPELAAVKSRKRRRRWWTLLGAAVVALGVVALFSFTEFDWRSVQRDIAALNPLLLFGLIATLPVFGLSVGVGYLVAGARFGAVGGGLVVAAATAVHLCATHWICRSFLRGAIERWLARRRHHLPEIPRDERVAVAAMAALVPGLPYFARNYLLALSGMPLRVYLPVCLPIYVARSYVTIFLGDLSGDPHRSEFLILVAVYVVKLAICALIGARLRKHYKQRHPSSAENSPPGSPTTSTPAARKKIAGIARSR